MHSKLKITVVQWLCLLCVLILFTQCNWYSGCQKINLTMEELSWFDVYDIGDTIVLESNKKNRDSLVVVIKDVDYSPCNKFELGNYQKNKYLVQLTSINCTSNPDFTTVAYRFDKVDSVETIKGFDVYDLSFSNRYKGHLKTEFKKTKIYSLQTKDSVNVYLADSTNCNFSKNQNIISFYWSKENGLVRYETCNGEIFELVPSSPTFR